MGRELKECDCYVPQFISERCSAPHPFCYSFHVLQLVYHTLTKAGKEATDLRHVQFMDVDSVCNTYHTQSCLLSEQGITLLHLKKKKQRKIKKMLSPPMKLKDY